MNITLPGKAATLMASQREQAERQRVAHGIEARSWYRITNAADPDEAELLLYDEVGGWWGCTADQMIADLRGVTAPNLRVRINSPGGSVFEGIAIANALRSHPAKVTCQVDGIAASIASVIAMAGDRIEMAPNTMMMIHDASGVCLGNAEDMEEMAELLDLISDNIADAYAARAGGTRDEWRARMRSETWYLPEDAVANGLADEAVQTPKTGEPTTPEEPEEPEEGPDMARPFDLSAYGYNGPAKPTAPPAEEPTMLTINLADALDEAFVEQLRAMVKQRSEPAAEAALAEPEHTPETNGPRCAVCLTPTAEHTGHICSTTQAPAEPGPALEVRGEHGPETVPLTATPEPVDEWAAAVARLTPDDAWSALVSNLIEPDSSSSATAA